MDLPTHTYIRVVNAMLFPLNFKSLIQVKIARRMKKKYLHLKF